MSMMAFESGGRPIIAMIGEAFEPLDIDLIQRAADELNITEKQPRYVVEVKAYSTFMADGTRIPEGCQKVRIAGSWVEDGDLVQLWERVEELRAEL